MDKPVKKYPTIAPCGLDCGLCPKYYTVGKSRCPGCCGEGFFEKHPSCSMITCCVQKNGLETCGECIEFPCPKFKTEYDYLAAETMSYPPNRKMLANLAFIKRNGIETFVKRQRERISLLEEMIKDYDEGRSRSLFCRAAGLMDVKDLTGCLAKAQKAVRESQVDKNDMKSKASILKKLLEDTSSKKGIELRIGKSKK